MTESMKILLRDNNLKLGLKFSQDQEISKNAKVHFLLNGKTLCNKHCNTDCVDKGIKINFKNRKYFCKKCFEKVLKIYKIQFYMAFDASY